MRRFYKHLSHARWTHCNAVQHAASPKVTLTLEAPIDQSIQDHFILCAGFADLDCHCSSPLFCGGVHYIPSKPLPAKVQWVQNLVTSPDALMHPE
eukprot:scaffold9342_cov65-Attheya_sp.AAC.1